MGSLVLFALKALYDVLTILILVRCFASFFIRYPYVPKWYKVIIDLTEPVLAPCRNLVSRFVPRMMIDFSPVLALILLGVIYRVLYMVLFRIFY